MVQKDNLTEEERLAELSGENEVMTIKFRVPLLKFNGKTGKFLLYNPDQEGKLPSRPSGQFDEIDCVILKVRRVLGAWETGPNDQWISIFSNEHNSWRDEIVLFERRAGILRPRIIDQGPSKQIRDKYRNLKLTQNLYVLFQDQIVKLPVKGKSLGALFEFYDTLSRKGEHIWQFVTKIQSHQETKGAVDFYVMDFLKQEKADFEVVKEKIEEVAAKLERQDKSFAERPMLEEEVEKELQDDSSETETSSQVPQEDEVKVEDIPF